MSEDNQAKNRFKREDQVILQESLVPIQKVFLKANDEKKKDILWDNYYKGILFGILFANGAHGFKVTKHSGKLNEQTIACIYSKAIEGKGYGKKADHDGFNEVFSQLLCYIHRTNLSKNFNVDHFSVENVRAFRIKMLQFDEQHIMQDQPSKQAHEMSDWFWRAVMRGQLFGFNTGGMPHELTNAKFSFDEIDKHMTMTVKKTWHGNPLAPADRLTLQANMVIYLAEQNAEARGTQKQEEVKQEDKDIYGPEGIKQYAPRGNAPAPAAIQRNIEIYAKKIGTFDVPQLFTVTKEMTWGQLKKKLNDGAGVTMVIYKNAKVTNDAQTLDDPVCFEQFCYN